MSNGETPGGFQPQHANLAPDSAPTRSFRFARDLHVRGRLIEAERAYRETLEAEPDRADALHLLGVLTAQRGDYRSAVSLIIRAESGEAPTPFSVGPDGSKL